MTELRCRTREPISTSDASPSMLGRKKPSDLALPEGEEVPEPQTTPPLPVKTTSSSSWSSLSPAKSPQRSLQSGAFLLSPSAGAVTPATLLPSPAVHSPSGIIVRSPCALNQSYRNDLYTQVNATPSSSSSPCALNVASATGQCDWTLLSADWYRFPCNASGSAMPRSALKKSRVDNNPTPAIKYKTWAPGSPHVSFASPSKTTVHPITPYSEVYGMHPKLFHVDRTRQKVLVDQQQQLLNNMLSLRRGYSSLF